MGLEFERWAPDLNNLQEVCEQIWAASQRSLSMVDTFAGTMILFVFSNLLFCAF